MGARYRTPAPAAANLSQIRAVADLPRRPLAAFANRGAAITAAIKNPRSPPALNSPLGGGGGGGGMSHLHLREGVISLSWRGKKILHCHSVTRIIPPCRLLLRHRKSVTPGASPPAAAWSARSASSSVRVMNQPRVRGSLLLIIPRYIRCSHNIAPVFFFFFFPHGGINQQQSNVNQ